MSKNTYNQTKVAGPFKSVILWVGGFLLFLAGFGLWSQGTEAILPALKIGSVGAAIFGVGMLIPSKNQFTQR